MHMLNNNMSGFVIVIVIAMTIVINLKEYHTTSVTPIHQACFEFWLVRQT